MESQYVNSKTILQRWAVSTSSLRRWSAQHRINEVRTPGGRRLYKLSDVELLLSAKSETRTVTAYARVSTVKQSEDLARQVKVLRSGGCTEIFSDVASGMNWKRQGLLNLLQKVHEGKVQSITVTHKDRLCRFAFELVEWILSRNQTRLIVLDKEPAVVEDTQELAEDLMAIVTSFSTRYYGKRSGRKRKLQNTDESN